MKRTERKITQKRSLGCMRPSNSYFPSGNVCHGRKWQACCHSGRGGEARGNLENQPHTLVPVRDLSSRACPGVRQAPRWEDPGFFFVPSCADPNHLRLAQLFWGKVLVSIALPWICRNSPLRSESSPSQARRPAPSSARPPP